MKISLLFIGIIVFSLFGSEICYASGSRAGNGGMGVVCRADDDSIKSARLLDMVEGESIQGYSYLQQDKIADYLKTVFARMSKTKDSGDYEYHAYFDFAYSLHKTYQFVKQVKIIDAGIFNAEDFNTVLKPRKGCAIEPVAYWNFKSNRLILNSEIYAHLDALNRAALWLHESLYRVARENRDTVNSDDIRAIVSFLLKEDMSEKEKKSLKDIFANQIIESDLLLEFGRHYKRVERISDPDDEYMSRNTFLGLHVGKRGWMVRSWKLPYQTVEVGGWFIDLNSIALMTEEDKQGEDFFHFDAVKGLYSRDTIIDTKSPAFSLGSLNIIKETKEEEAIEKIIYSFSLLRLIMIKGRYNSKPAEKITMTINPNVDYKQFTFEVENVVPYRYILATVRYFPEYNKIYHQYTNSLNFLANYDEI